MRILLGMISFIFLMGCGDNSTTEGDRYFKEGEYEKAISAYDHYLSTRPKHIKSLYNRGRSYEELKIYEKALEDFQKILEIDKNNVQANLSIGIDALRNDEVQKALFYFEQSVNSAPDNPKALILRGRAFHKIGNFKSAMKDFDTAIRVNNDAGEAYFYRGIILLDSNKQKACLEFQKAFNLDVKDAEKALDAYCR